MQGSDGNPLRSPPGPPGTGDGASPPDGHRTADASPLPAKPRISVIRGGGGVRDFDIASDFDRTDRVPSCFGTGTIRSITVSDRIQFLNPKTNDGSRQERVTTVIDNKVPLLGICYVMDIGPGSHAWLEGQKLRLETRKAHVMVNSANAPIHHELPENGDVWLMDLFIHPEKLLELFEDASDPPAEEMRRLVEAPDGEPRLFRAPFDSMAPQIVRRIETCPYTGGLQKVYLEGMALEMAAHAFGLLWGRGRRLPPPTRMEWTRMGEAREILDGRIRNPPTLSETAETLGISLSKLKRDFKKVHGLNVHEYLIARRLDEARKLMVEESRSAKEAAFLVGYRNPSHFARAFRRRFGESPREAKKRIS